MAKTSGATISMTLVLWVGVLLLWAKYKTAGAVTTDASGSGAILANAPFLVTNWADIVEQERGSTSNNFILAIIWQESGGNPLAKGAAGEIGLMQIMPLTGSLYGATTPEELWNPVMNIRVGARYLQYCFDNTPTAFDALRAYNAGVTGSRRSPLNGKAYANSVMNKFNGTSGLDYS